MVHTLTTATSRRGTFMFCSTPENASLNSVWYSVLPLPCMRIKRSLPGLDKIASECLTHMDHDIRSLNKVGTIRRVILQSVLKMTSVACDLLAKELPW